jgi:ABC-type lipoprotein release transport system permease subunit
MNPLRLALRTMLMGRRRSLAAALLIGASLCVLDLYCGHLASQASQLEYQAVVGERLGHLAVTRTPGPSGQTAFEAAEAARAKRILAGIAGVALVLPQLDVTGVTSSGTRSALFVGTGVTPPPDAPAVVANEPGRIASGQRRAIAVSSAQAGSLALHNGSAVTLSTGTPAQLRARVVDIFSTSTFNANARSVLMPFEMAQTLLDTKRTERLVVFLSNPATLDEKRAALAAALRSSGVPAEVRSWRDLSAAYIDARRAADLRLGCLLAIVLVVIAALVAAATAMNALERRRELATLRALGMSRTGVFALLVAEASWMALAGIAVSVAASGLLAWVVNRAVAPWPAQPDLAAPPMVVELDFARMLAAFAAVLVVALAASLASALKAARDDLPQALGSGGGHPGF